MNSYWEEGVLSDIATIEMGQSPSGNECNTMGKGIPLLNGPTEFGSNHPAPKQFTTDPKKLAEKFDLLFCVRGSTTGRMNWSNQRYAIGRGLAAIRHKNGNEYQPFLKATIEFHLNELLSSATGSTFPNVSRNQLSNLIIEKPPLSEQKAIAHILGSLDDKIELNLKMNETLEGMAQALFKSWFVDFDPVIDNAIEAGNPIPEEFEDRAETRQDALKNGAANRDISKQFPDSFKFTEELGWIPEGWEVKELGAITTELRRGISPKYTEDDGIRVINQRCIRDHSVNYLNARKNDPIKRKVDGRHLQVGDLLINSTGVGTLGRMAQIQSLNEPTVTDSHVTVVRSDPKEYLPYTFGRMMISIEPEVEAMGHGSTGQIELRRADLNIMPVIVPPLLNQSHAETIFTELSKKCDKDNTQNSTLSKLRDTLLPRLISGELRIPDAEKLVKEAIDR